MKPDWKEYEDLVCDALRRENPDLIIQRDVMLDGYKSQTKRQIDILATGKIAGHDVVAIIDCKKYSRKLNVNDIGSFTALLDDVNADIGILVTQQGFSKSAENSAKRSRVKLEIKKLEELQEYKITFDYCEECDGRDDNFPGVIQWVGFESLVGDEDKVDSIGHCDWCGTLHIRCQECNTATGIPDLLYEEDVQCSGECGTIFRIDLKYIGHGMNDLILTVKSSNE